MSHATGRHFEAGAGGASLSARSVPLLPETLRAQSLGLGLGAVTLSADCGAGRPVPLPTVLGDKANAASSDPCGK